MKPLLLTLLLTLPAFAQGPLAPPTAADPAVGPTPPLVGTAPQPTMKTLFQVEPRTAVQSLSATPPYTISQSGSYYLTGNITVTTGNAIAVTCDDVSLDLNGFTIKSTASPASGYAVFLADTRNRITVRNGSITSGSTVAANGATTALGFTQGIYAVTRLNQGLVSDLHISGIAGNGVFIDGTGLIERCTAVDCTSYGLYADEIRDCTALRCGSTAIYALGNVTQCTGASVNSIGINSNGNALNCTASSTFYIGLSAFGNADNCSATTTATITSGYALSAHGNAKNCTGTAVAGSGIIVNGNAEGCTGTTTGTTASVYGILCSGTAQGCNATSSASSAIQAICATNCYGSCTGTLADSHGVFCTVATNCTGITANAAGIRASTASNCYGKTTGTVATTTGVLCAGTATGCTCIGNSGSSVALNAAVAIGCTVTSGTLSVPTGKTFNM